MGVPSIWIDRPCETENPIFWICYHATMLFIHGAMTYQQLDEIYVRYTNKSIKDVCKENKSDVILLDKEED